MKLLPSQLPGSSIREGQVGMVDRVGIVGKGIMGLGVSKSTIGMLSTDVSIMFQILFLCCAL